MIGEKMRNAINQQIKHELESSYLYLAMEAYFHAKGLDGMAQWMRVQVQEELTHAGRFFDHVVNRDGQVELKNLEILQTTWDSPLAAFSAAYKHEQFITGKINDLVKLALEEKDFAANTMLQWFVTEQMEEEQNTSKVAQDLEIVGDNGHGLLMLDRELGARTFVMPPAGAAADAGA
jgi:ferritin